MVTLIERAKQLIQERKDPGALSDLKELEAAFETDAWGMRGLVQKAENLRYEYLESMPAGNTGLHQMTEKISPLAEVAGTASRNWIYWQSLRDA